MMKEADLAEMLAFLRNRQFETAPGSYEHFMYGQIMRQLQEEE
jgi:hypothetical protein